MPKTRLKKRDIFEWVGVGVDIIQALLFATALLAALIWFAQTGGLPAVVVATGMLVLVLLVGVLILLSRRH